MDVIACNYTQLAKPLDVELFRQPAGTRDAGNSNVLLTEQ
jgi:hypothetical protein